MRRSYYGPSFDTAAIEAQAGRLLAAEGLVLRQPVRRVPKTARVAPFRSRIERTLCRWA